MLAESRGSRVAGGEERRRLEGELHDSAQNRLVGLQIRLSLARERTEQTAPEVAAALTRLIDEAEAVGEELRRIAHGISPPFSVHDDTRGFDPRATPPGTGLTGVRDRIETVGGSVEITAAPDCGTTVAGVVPWPPRAA